MTLLGQRHTIPSTGGKGGNFFKPKYGKREKRFQRHLLTILEGTYNGALTTVKNSVKGKKGEDLFSVSVGGSKSVCKDLGRGRN